MNIVIAGLSITSSWGNGHATTYRALISALHARGHKVVFLERNVPWYAENRDLPSPPYCETALYQSIEDLHAWTPNISTADVVVVGSYVPDGAEVINWVLEHANGVRAFYDIDTPVTLASLDTGECEYLRAVQIPAFDVYLSFTSGRSLTRLENDYGARRARPLFCAVDPERYRPTGNKRRWHLGYLGTYSPDRQEALEQRLLEPARRWANGRFVVAGPQFPDAVGWPKNVHRIEHLSPHQHPSFYCAQQFTLNVTRAAMVSAGHAPSVRLFEAAACGTPIISDAWTGLEEFFEPGKEIIVTQSAEETLAYIRGLGDVERSAIAHRARRRVLSAHTSTHRACEFERYVRDTQTHQRLA